MSDFLLIHDMGHGAWSWARVWGLLDADESGKVGRIATMDLPGHGTRRSALAASVDLAGAVDAAMADIQAYGLRRPIVAAHGFGAMVALHLAARLKPAPERLVFFAGAIPDDGATYADVLTLRAQLALGGAALLRPRADVPFSKAAARFLLTNGVPYHIAAGDVIGLLQPFPRGLLYEPFVMPELPPGAHLPPVTYVTLAQDQFIDPRNQARMAAKLPKERLELAEMDICHEAPTLAPEAAYRLVVRHATPSPNQGLRLLPV